MITNPFFSHISSPAVPDPWSACPREGQ